jgi:hypothetical protein
MLARWEEKRNSKNANQEISLALGIPVDEIGEEEHSVKVFQYVANKYSSEHFCNRLSDLCGSVQVVWNWVGFALRYGFLIGVIWSTVKYDLSDCVYAWGVLGILLFAWISSYTIGLICYLLTGRFPGQAKQARKLLSGFVSK